MTKAFIEHVNITVGDPDRTAEMLKSLFGWEERWRGNSMMGGRSIHVGSDSHYLAVYTGQESSGSPMAHQKGAPLNHVGIQVDDLDAVEARVIALGLTPFAHDDYEPGRRFYFFDENGIEFEVVSYAA
ncbi:MAG: VOC family protein [Sphingomonadaceae bacterium]|nr:VOC family protein [Sphingomonadaceae bacterium]